MVEASPSAVARDDTRACRVGRKLRSGSPSSLGSQEPRDQREGVQEEVSLVSPLNGRILSPTCKIRETEAVGMVRNKWRSGEWEQQEKGPRES